ncbi:MAG: hypothetical protein F6K56_04135 [Moorea sp. SIO3G5]|nr:hypothetical protein [Moorena sp. SIO3G5]
MLIPIRYTGFFTTPYSLLPTPYSLLPTPYSLLPTPYSLLPTPYSLNASQTNASLALAGNNSPLAKILVK